MIHVTKTFLPPQEIYQSILKRAWDNNWITNRGELVLELEDKLKTYLKVPNMIAATNGTLPLQIAIKALNLTGEIITTSFSYVATTSSIVWEGCKPIFVDIHPEYLTIDETKIEAAITPKTSAILATHVFGNPCHVEAIEAIARKHNLKVIYDAAHCFGVNYKGESIFNYGDISSCSFHATKIFHTGEGGALFCKQQDLYNTLFYHHNFGHKGHEDFQGLGINAKMSELQAAMGLAVFPFMPQIMEWRRRVVQVYENELNFTKLTFLKIREHTVWNYSYYPIVFESEHTLKKAMKRLQENDIYPRRYFYPALHNLPYLNTPEMPISELVARRILCLPLSHDLSDKDTKKICKLVNAVL
ncbi:DegT/DnrJ/EryC1/StrS family aminotransferase [Aegicerativicinus sediminis]|uniref:DegT/DnrJ/EryC1/StrS family aminotransferase n=1 Tax=Aegicerativicinus sediminis TaxID=2893202 RepID=UPI001E62C74A|nr:DegT/DnrJ/EryC1/StrS family aminotransferase [Aegicerativicinus sediminis]